MRFHHLIGGLVLGVAAVGLGAAIASPALGELGYPAEARGAFEIGAFFLFPTLIPSIFIIRAIARGAQVRSLREQVDLHDATLLRRFVMLTSASAKGGVNMRGWNDEVWRFRRCLPRRYGLINDAAACKIVTDRVIELAESAAPAPTETSVAQPSLAARVERELSALGWRAKLIAGADARERHVLAEKNGIRALVLCCAHGDVTNGDVARVVEARVRLGADLAAVAAHGFTRASRTLARATRVGLITPGNVREIHRAAGRLWRARRMRQKIAPFRPAANTAH